MWPLVLVTFSNIVLHGGENYALRWFPGVVSKQGEAFNPFQTWDKAIKSRNAQKNSNFDFSISQSAALMTERLTKG